MKMAENHYRIDHEMFFKLAFKPALNAHRRTARPMRLSGLDRTALNASKAACDKAERSFMVRRKNRNGLFGLRYGLLHVNN